MANIAILELQKSRFTKSVAKPKLFRHCRWYCEVKNASFWVRTSPRKRTSHIRKHFNITIRGPDWLVCREYKIGDVKISRYCSFKDRKYGAERGRGNRWLKLAGHYDAWGGPYSRGALHRDKKKALSTPHLSASIWTRPYGPTAFSRPRLQLWACYVAADLERIFLSLLPKLYIFYPFG